MSVEAAGRNRIVRAIPASWLWIPPSFGISWELDGKHFGDDGIVLAAFLILAGGGIRAIAGLLAILTFWATFPPLGWPLYWICFTPIVWLFRQTDPPRRVWIGEAFGIGFAMCWLSLPFVRADFPRFGWLIQALAASLFGLQMIAIAATLRATRHRPAILAALLAAGMATAFEVIRAHVLGWPLLSIALPAAPSPLAQWASLFGPFGVSFILSLVHFLWLPVLRDGTGL